MKVVRETLLHSIIQNIYPWWATSKTGTDDSELAQLITGTWNAVPVPLQKRESDFFWRSVLNWSICMSELTQNSTSRLYAYVEQLRLFKSSVLACQCICIHWCWCGLAWCGAHSSDFVCYFKPLHSLASLVRVLLLLFFVLRCSSFGQLACTYKLHAECCFQCPPKLLKILLLCYTFC